MAALFHGERLWGYDFPFPETDRSAAAYSLLAALMTAAIVADQTRCPVKYATISDVPLAPRKAEMNVHFPLITICTPKRCMVCLFSSENNCILKEVLL